MSPANNGQIKDHYLANKPACTIANFKGTTSVVLHIDNYIELFTTVTEL